MYLVSILVPVFKVEAYIERCARSLFEQSYNELEFVFIDDKSPDQSISILKKVCTDYPHRQHAIHIIHHDVNKGLAASRNTALNHAKGAFVCVVDSDDWLETNAIELLVARQIESDADIVAGSMMMHLNDGDFPFFEKEYSSKKDAVLRQLEKSWDHTICRKLVRRSLFEINHIRCIEGYDMTEDRYQMAQLAYFANSYVQINDIIYHYERRNENSIMAQKDKQRVLRKNYEYLQNWLAIRDFFFDKDDIYFSTATEKAMSFAKEYVYSIIKLKSRNWYHRIANILDKETPNNQALAGWTTQGIKGFFLHNFFLVELHYQRTRIERFIKRRILGFSHNIHIAILLLIGILCSCTSQVFGFEIEVSIDKPITLTKGPYRDWESTNIIFINQYAPLGLSHQSAAAYGDYAFFVTNGRGKFCMYNLAKKEIIYSLSRNAGSANLYHSNESTFGTERYSPDDPFPLLYVSQRNNSSGRCFIEGFRIMPHKAEGAQEYDSFTVELVQTIFLPVMNYENSLGNANCVIDASNKVMYTYSRNNRSVEDNYLMCRITKFEIPSPHLSVVTYDDEDILNSFMLDCTAMNMQGGCIEDGILYIGQGIPSDGDLYFNVIDLEKQSLVRRFALKDFRVSWEPEGCFFYDGRIMLCHTTAISEVLK